ncbi:hypothetical protein JCM10207_007837 [Rhodosporidiobolus poonsookiae]
MLRITRTLLKPTPVVRSQVSLRYLRQRAERVRDDSDDPLDDLMPNLAKAAELAKQGSRGASAHFRRAAIHFALAGKSDDETDKLFSYGPEAWWLEEHLTLPAYRARMQDIFPCSVPRPAFRPTAETLELDRRLALLGDKLNTDLKARAALDTAQALRRFRNADPLQKLARLVPPPVLEQDDFVQFYGEQAAQSIGLRGSLGKVLATDVAREALEQNDEIFNAEDFDLRRAVEKGLESAQAD